MVSSKCVVLRKFGGFYQAFDDDALIISYLFNYRINNSRCGFPIKSLNKVINILEEKNISYTVKGDENLEYDFKRKNNYNKYLTKSKAKNDINNRINNIISKLEKLDENELEKILNMFEDNIYE